MLADPPTISLNGSHRTTVRGDRITIHDLELFSGFDPDVDAPKSSIARYTDDRIHSIIDHTNKLAGRGQTPKMILGHTPDDAKDSAGSKEEPAYGDIGPLKFRQIGGGPGIVGDVEMSIADFEHFIKSNRYPRRSAEIFGNALASVALLGANKPARPLPDTKFADDAEPERFVRRAETVHITEAVMPEPKKNDNPKPDADALQVQIDELKAANQTLSDENETLKASAKRAAGSDQEVETLRNQIDALQEKFQESQIDRILDSLENDGFHVGGDNREHFVGMFKGSEGKWSETEKFIRATVKQDPINKRIDTTGAELNDDGTPESVAKMREVEMQATKMAQDKIEANQEFGDRAKFNQYFREAKNELLAAA